jgi:hypothetical protein
MRIARRRQRSGRVRIVAVCLLLLAGCAHDRERGTETELTPSQVHALILHLLPSTVADRDGWATDMQAAFRALDIAATPEHVCGVVAVTEQESGFQADPPVPGLASMAWKQIDARASRLHVPKKLVRTALKARSPDGRSYAERIDAAKTERELSEVFDDLIDSMPLGKTLLADRNPVRTGGPMQVSIAFAEAHAAARPYPFPVNGSIRREVFTRRGGMYFGTAHLLDYPADYDQMLYRFADYNAGRYASRNAAFQQALSIASGVPLVPDGDLLPADGGTSDRPGATEAAARSIAQRLRLSDSNIHRDLGHGRDDAFPRTALYKRVYALAEQLERRALPRAALPQIELAGPKISRQLTTGWFARRVDERYQRCLARRPQPGP